jgi:hypothetical protein
MIVKFLEAFFRHKWLLILPPLLIPLIVGPIALLNASTYYEAGAGVWVDRAAYLNANDGFNSYLTPAQNQANRLTDMLRTRSFVMSIASRTSLAPLVGNEAGERAIERIFYKGFSMAPSGERLLVLRFRGATPQLSHQMVIGVIEAFRERVTSDRLEQASTAISFYEQRAKVAEEELNKANDALKRYVAANPRLTTIDPERGAAATTADRLGLPAGAIDPQIAELLRKVDIQQADFDRTRQALEEARMESSAAIQGQDFGFRVVDEPKLPTRAIRERRKALIYPASGMVVGLGISALALVILVAGDRAVRSERDLNGVARIVGSVPQLRLGRGTSKKAGPDATRRAIGFSAGAFLPLGSGTPSTSGAS